MGIYTLSDGILNNKYFTVYKGLATKSDTWVGVERFGNVSCEHDWKQLFLSEYRCGGPGTRDTKNRERVKRGSSTVKTTDSSSRGPEIDPQHRATHMGDSGFRGSSALLCPHRNQGCIWCKPAEHSHIK